MARAFSSWWPLLSTGLAGFARKSDALAPKALALPCGNSASSASACSSPGPAAGAQTPGDSGGHVASGVSPGSRLFPEWGDSFRGAWALQPGAPGTGEQRVHPSAPGRPPDPRRSATASAALDGPCPVSWARSPPRRAGPGVGGTKSPGWELSRGLGLAGVGAPGVGEGSQETRQKAPSSPPPSVRRPRAISGRQLPGPPRASQCCGLVPTR